MYKFLLYLPYYLFILLLILSTSGNNFFIKPQITYQCSQKNYNPIILSSQINQFCRQSFDCPSGSLCMEASNYSQIKICCTSNLKVSCPSNYSPVLDLNGQYIYCSVTNGNVCVSGSQCLQSPTQSMVYLCCKSSTAPTICPNNQDALVTDGQLEICNGPENSCSSDGYTCQYSTTISNWVCCGDSVIQNPICRDGELPYSPNLNELYICNDTLSMCPTGYICEESTQPSVNVCCSNSFLTTTTLPTSIITTTTTSTITTTTTTSQLLLTCPKNWNPYRYILGNYHICNSPLDTSSCPFGYSCVPSNIIDIFICCRYAMSFECTKKNSTLLLNNQPRLCSNSLPNTCPVDYDCLPSTNSNINICCKKEMKLECKNGRNIGMIDGHPQYCSNYGYQDTCKFGYICNNSTIDGLYVCCYVL